MDKSGCGYDVFHTGDKTSWCFEVRNYDGVLIGEGFNIASKEQAIACAKQFIQWVLLK